MQNTAWVSLLQRLPRDLHDNVSLVTKGGIEIAVQGILRMEDDYLVIRGRLAGTQEGGRAFFIPYDQLDFAMFQKPMPEAHVQALFEGAPNLAFAASPEAPAELPEADAEVAPPEAPPDQTPTPGGVAAAAAQSATAKSSLAKKSILDRLRARSNLSGGSKPGKSSK